MKMKKFIPSLLALAVIPAFAAATDATPKRVGPVSYYGALHTSGGKIVGAKNNQEAVIRGMSMFWSDATGTPYYNKNVISWAAENLHIDVFRFAMGIQYYDSDGGTTNKLDAAYSYVGAKEGYKGLVDQMVQAAIENDIYIILDWHSHRADYETSDAKEFFTEMASKYKDVPNVIYEIFNEPRQGQAWSSITGYANSVIPGIRQSTENLILVGTPSWSQLDSYGGINSTNIGYVFHFYAATHSTGSFSSRITQAKGSGSPVFITEWGTVKADGKGSPDQSATSSWMSFMDQNNISNCNWSLRNTNSKYKDNDEETSAMFEGKEDLTTVGKLNSATYSSSGNLVKNYLIKHARSWGDSLVKGKNSGTCAFKSTTAKETDTQITGVLKSGCTYESSNPGAVIVNGGNLTITGPGYSILTGNDGSQSFVQVTPIPRQTITNFQDLTCSYDGACSSNRSTTYSGGTNKEWVITADTKTLEGSSFTLTSLDESIVKVKKATCTSNSCANTVSNKQVYMYEFTGFGTAKVVATAAAVTGYRAMNDTITVTVKKGSNKMTNNFKNTKLALGASADKLVPDTTMYHTKVTYTFNGKESSSYVTKNGNALVAGNQNAIVLVTAHAPETDTYVELNQTITVIVGDSSQAVNKEEYNAAKHESETAPVLATKPKLPMQATVAGNMLNISSSEAGEINVDIFSVTGQSILSKNFSSKNAALSLKNVPNGSYLITVKQGSKLLNIQWNKN
jgi:endoglucanase